MFVVSKFTTKPEPCAYLGDRPARLEYSFAAALSAEEYEDLMNKGYRKFGSAFFQPVCKGCTECRPIRVDAEQFTPDRSQRRCLKQNQDLKIVIQPPVCDQQRLNLYHRYHAARTAEKGWPEQLIDAEEYQMSLVENPLPCTEISIWEGSQLRALVINDLTPNTVSAIYHFHDPDCASRGLGTFCVLQCIELAKTLAKRWVYLGYFVNGSSSMQYKARFKPFEIMDTKGVWKRTGGLGS